MASKISGAEAMTRCLQNEGVNTIFGYPGAMIIPFYDSISRSGIRHVLTCTEQGAGHAANGYARMTGRPGVCVTTSGPGATNMFTALATAYSDSIPIVAITGQVVTRLLGSDVFQEVDTTGAVEPFTKYSYLVKSADELCRVFKEAFHIASTGRPGPVLIDVPVDVQEQMVDFLYPGSVNIRGYKPRHEGHPLQVKKVAGAISEAKRPLLCCGGGVVLSGAQDGFVRLCEETGIPAVSTMMGIGIMPPEHPLYYGMLGQNGSDTANLAVSESDLLIIVGARVADRAITKPSELESGPSIVHIDIDTAEIGKNVGATIPLVGDAAQVLEQLRGKNPDGHRPDWLKRLDGLRSVEQENIIPRKDGSIDPAVFVKMLCGQLSGDSVYVADVGQNQLWSAKNFCAKGRFLTTGGMGTMGYSIPAAIGAKKACPEREVVAVCGDGAFQMSMNELATIRRENLPVKIVVMRNNRLGLVRRIQKNKYDGRTFAVGLEGSPDFGKLAEAYGIGYGIATNQEDCGGAISRMFEADGPYLLECVIDPEED